MTNKGGRPQKKKRNDEVCRLFDKGMKVRDIAEQIGESYDNTVHILWRHRAEWIKNNFNEKK